MTGLAPDLCCCYSCCYHAASPRLAVAAPAAAAVRCPGTGCCCSPANQQPECTCPSSMLTAVQCIKAATKIYYGPSIPRSKRPTVTTILPSCMLLTRICAAVALTPNICRRYRHPAVQKEDFKQVGMLVPGIVPSQTGTCLSAVHLTDACHARTQRLHRLHSSAYFLQSVHPQQGPLKTSYC